ncbi:MAG: ABC transporter substrate-binding protein, partial [Chlamydiales bacterium]
GEYDWVGEPFSRLTNEMIDQLKQLKQIQKRAVVRPFWLYLNTKDKVLKSNLIRQAIAHCIDRVSITQNSLREDTPLFTPTPSRISSNTHFFPGKDPEKAKILFKEGLSKLGYTTPPSFVIRCCDLPGFSEFARELQQTLEKYLPISCYLETMDWNQLRSYLERGEFQIAACTQLAILNDPLEFLGRFAADGIPNFSQWSDTHYQRVLDCAADSEEKKGFLQNAERILTTEMPFIPIANGVHLFAQNPKLKGTAFDDSGSVDLSYSYFED